MSTTIRKFKTVITKTGAAKLAQAAAPDGKPVRLTHMAVGDGGGTLPTPDSKQTCLVHEVWRHTINRVTLDTPHPNRIIAELVIPPETGGFWIREIGVFDEHGDLIAVGNTAESYKPTVAEGSGRAQTFRTILTVSSAATVELTVDNTMVMATVDYVDDKLKEHERSRNHPDATLDEKGFTQLSSETDSSSEDKSATPKAVKAVMDETQKKAPLDSPALTGNPTAPTPDLNATGREIATVAFVAAKVAQLVDSSPESLNTLKELAEALGNDPHFATTMLNALAGKQPLHEILTSLSGLATAGNKLPYFSDRNVMTLANLTAVGRVLIGQNSKDEVLSYLGLVETIKLAAGALPITGGNLQGQIFFSLSQPRDGANHLIYNNDDKGIMACAYGYYQDRFDIHFYDEKGAWVSNPLVIHRNGNTTINGDVAAHGIYDYGQRVYSPNNPPPGYATQQWVLQNFVQNIDLTAPTEFQFWDGRGYMRATDGAAMYNFSMVGGSSNVGWIVIRYTRKLVNNTWYVIN